jgi:hypothetical protein
MPDQLPLSQIKQSNRVVSTRPLAFDVSHGYVYGATAILHRCLYAVTCKRGRLVWSAESRGRGIDIRDLQNATLNAQGRDGWKRAIVRQLKSVDYVIDATAGLALDGNTWIVAFAVTLTDGLGGIAGTYPLEVSIGNAGAAINALESG